MQHPFDEQLCELVERNMSLGLNPTEDIIAIAFCLLKASLHLQRKLVEQQCVTHEDCRDLLESLIQAVSDCHPELALQRIQ
jgi:hypothetical protein